MSHHPLTNFEIQQYYQDEPKFNGVYSKDKDEAYITTRDENFHIETHWVALYVQNNDVNYFDSFGVDIFQKKLKHLSIIKR